MVLHRKSLPEQVKSALIDSILSGEIAPGERLVELELAAKFDVSQGSVRDALRDLTSVGLVTKNANRGTYASDFVSSGMHEIFTVRAALEELATRIATPLLTNDVAPLQAAVDAMVAAAKLGDADGVSAHSLAFHALIVDAAGNTILSSMWRSLHLETHTKVVAQQQSDELLALAESHQILVDTIAAGDIEQACLAARNHQDELDNTTQQTL